MGMIERIISGGQTGADRAALDAAIHLGYATGGWVPQGRTDENGVIPPHYSNLVEADDENPATRTELNVRDSDATVIFSHGPLMGGSALTKTKANDLGKPHCHLDLSSLPVPEAVEHLRLWLHHVDPNVLNVAGPRASTDPTIYEKTREILESVLSTTKGVSPTS